MYTINVNHREAARYNTVEEAMHEAQTLKRGFVEVFEEETREDGCIICHRKATYKNGKPFEWRS